MATQKNDLHLKGSEAAAVLDKLRSDKTLEALQQEALQRLRDDFDFHKQIENLIANSKAMNEKHEGARRQKYLKNELEERVVTEATEKYWELLSSREHGMAASIEACVQAALSDVLVQHNSRENGS